ncbi:L-lactate dehydrogenase [Sphingomonas solaris]|uniref:L-lactate dehydrogenase n=1 Tax=Alterirhizorhabdus solaris TaxID=2529389 RepID=A0A558R6V5_9SPHN|nr:L-lactate dehydrogenase [Sphingomonas solaris]TVV75119.1 L-lactate dehydrogenase [Sphingomonas solaris]
MSRIAMIGAGHVGATAAYALMLRALVSEIVLIDSDPGLAEAEAADLADANALARPARIWAGTYADAASATIAVVTAGAATHGSETRLTVASRSASIVRACVSQLAGAGFGGIILVAANPVDLMALVALRASGLPASRVIGTGTLLDTARLRQALAAELHVAPTAIEALVVGEHGDSEVAAFFAARVGGLGLAQFQAPAPDREHVARGVREAGYRIIAGKGYTSFGIATAIVRICEAILRDERAILPVSVALTGEFGITDLYLSLPCLLGAGGIERILLPDLDAAEQAGLRASAAILRENLAVLDAGS